jgi:type VI secretion system protein VasJ
MTFQSPISLGKKPLSEEAPAGRDVRDLEIFLELQGEIDRSQSISQSSPVDWKKVQRLSTEILDKEGKDLLVACYLSVALTRNEGPPGFLAGLIVINDLVGEFWESLYPTTKRMRGRRNAITWWMDALKELLPALEAPPLSPEEMESAGKVIRELNRTIGEKDPDGPLLGTLVGLVGNLPVLEPEPQKRPEEVDTPAGSAPETSHPTEEAVAPPEEIPFLFAGTPEEKLERIYPAMRDLSEAFFNSDPNDFRAYRYGRMAIWDPITDLPDATDQVTRIPPPPHPLQSALETLLISQNTEDLLDFCETRQKDFPFWLDLSFHEAMVLEKNGANGQKAGLSIKAELIMLTKRLPGIDSLAFSDNTPFLSPSGREWISRSQDSKPDAQERDRLSTATIFEPIRHLIEEQKFGEAASRFEETRKSANSGQLRFLLNAEFLSAVLGKGRDFPVETIARSLLSEADRVGLDHWDPSLAKQILPLIYQAFSQSEDTELKKESTSLMRRLIDIDISRAVELYQMRW